MWKSQIVLLNAVTNADLLSRLSPRRARKTRRKNCNYSA